MRIVGDLLRTLISSRVTYRIAPHASLARTRAHTGRSSSTATSYVITICRRQANTGSSTMRGVKKENLPTKVCVTCERPFTWRKKWESCWDEVTTCSKSCNAKRRAAKQGANAAERGENDEEEEDDDDRSSGSEGVKSERAKHKAAVKAQKASRRARLEFNGDPTSGQKSCDECNSLVNELIRCQTDASKRWKMVCGKCWVKVSGGVVDGDAEHPFYRYGGLWKNRRAQNSTEDFAPVSGVEAA